jgi:ribokinase
MAFDVVVLGSLHMDIVVSAPDRPRRGETLAGHGWSLKPGGKGGNQAVAAAGAGARTAMIGAVGDDEFGQPLLENLQAIGVDASHVAVRRDAGSGMSVAIVDAGGDYGAVIVSGVNLLLDAANLAAAAKARQHGVSTILTAAPARPFPAGLNGLIDVLVVNEIEAEAMAATAVDSLATATDAAKRLLDFADAVIVTAGAAGASLARRNGRTAEIAGHQVRLVSTHGAGDCFVGVLAARLSRGDELEQAARYANAAAALRVASPPGPARAIDPAAIRNLLESGNTDSIR